METTSIERMFYEQVEWATKIAFKEFDTKYTENGKIKTIERESIKLANELKGIELINYLEEQAIRTFDEGDLKLHKRIKDLSEKILCDNEEIIYWRKKWLYQQ